MKRRILAALIIATLGMNLCAQSSGTTAPEPLINASHPLWLRDLRRAEIVAFGSFPFTFFASNFGMDMYRTSQNNWDLRYAPWPAKSAGAVNMTEDEFVITVVSAVVGAVCIALLDQVIVQVKRRQAAKAAALLPVGSPIIITTPWPEDTSVQSGQDLDSGSLSDADQDSDIPLEADETPGIDGMETLE